MTDGMLKRGALMSVSIVEQDGRMAVNTLYHPT